jgi:predicted transcriptional regulator
MTKTQQTIYLDKDTKAQLRLKAYQDNKSQNKIITEALKHYLNNSVLSAQQ